MVKPNSLKIKDDDIVRIYKENKQNDWGKQIYFLAHLNGASEMDIVSILERRSDDLGTAARPKRTSPNDYILILPTPSPRAFDQIALQRIDATKAKAKHAIDELKAVVRSLEMVEVSIKENGLQNKNVY